MKKPSKLLLSYLAGFVDGEGSIGINANDRGTSRVCYDSRFVVTNTNKEVLDIFKSVFGGSVGARKKISGRKPVWTWSTSNKLAVNALRLLRPYLRIKRYQADLIFEWSKTVKKVGPDGHSEYVVDKRVKIVRQIHVLNKVGSMEGV